MSKPVKAVQIFIDDFSSKSENFNNVEILDFGTLQNYSWLDYFNIDYNE